MYGRAIVVACLGVLLVLPLRADVRVALTDGRMLDGRDLWRESGDYVLELENGETIVIPEAFVEQVQLAGEPAPGEEEPPEEDPDAWRQKSGVVEGQSRTLGGQEPSTDAPTGIDRDSGARTLAGDPVSPPRTSDQLRVFGEPSQFQKDVVHNDWVPSTDWDMVNGVNNFAPSSWAKGVSDSAWKPDSAWSGDSDALARGQTQWTKPIVDSSWKPTNGFGG